MDKLLMLHYFNNSLKWNSINHLMTTKMQRTITKINLRGWIWINRVNNQLYSQIHSKLQIIMNLKTSILYFKIRKIHLLDSKQRLKRKLSNSYLMTVISQKCLALTPWEKQWIKLINSNHQFFKRARHWLISHPHLTSNQILSRIQASLQKIMKSRNNLRGLRNRFMIETQTRRQAKAANSQSLSKMGTTLNIYHW